MAINSNMDIEIKSKCEVKIIDGKTYIYFIDEIELDRSNFEQRVKIITLMKKTTLGEVASKFGTTQGNFFSRCRTGKMSFSEQRKIAEIFGCDIVIKFVFSDGTELTANSVRELVAKSCSHIGITQSELGERLGKSRQTFSSKLINGRFTDSEIAEIAEKLGCAYVNYFDVDGIEI